MNNEARALEAYREALRLAPPAKQDTVRGLIPKVALAKL